MPAAVAALPDSSWLGVELRHLVALREVAQEQSFKGAARRLGYSQSAVSQQIAMLERLVGQTLLERSTGGRAVTLTVAGSLLLKHAEAIASRMAAAKAEMDALAIGKTGVVRVGAFQTAGAKILPEALTCFLAQRPGISVDLSESIADLEQLEQLERGLLDFTFAVLPLPEGPFDWAELLVDPFTASVSADSELARREEISLEELGRVPLVCFRSCRITQVALDALRAEGIEPNIVFRSDQNEVLQGAVASGVATALLPSLSTDESDRRTRQLRIVPEVPPRMIVAAWRSDRELTPSAAALVDAAREVCAGLARS
ncbi:MAG: LysR family transcriptional regulator [Actinomycetota bacterium]|nr:LysR family transcriptional regulator [Actinomycetota bacterium]